MALGTRHLTHGGHATKGHGFAGKQAPLGAQILGLGDGVFRQQQAVFQ